jgi:hypothetical protein
VQFSYFAGNKQLNQHLFPAKCVYQVFAGNADKRHQGGVSEALNMFHVEALNWLSQVILSSKP